MIRPLELLFNECYEKLDNSVQADIYITFFNLVYPNVMGMVRDHSATEDIIQDSFLKVLRKIPDMSDQSHAESWLKTVARNTAINFLRKWQRMWRELATERSSLLPGFERTSYYPIEQEVEARMMREAIYCYIDQMKPEYRTALEMRWKEHLSYKEMAEELGVSEGIVRQRLYRAREVVKGKLQQEWGIGEPR
jgi:RNA polymerase sigma-70 factor (ECF subfamily)